MDHLFKCNVANYLGLHEEDPTEDMRILIYLFDLCLLVFVKLDEHHLRSLL